MKELIGSNCEVKTTNTISTKICEDRGFIQQRLAKRTIVEILFTII